MNSSDVAIPDTPKRPKRRIGFWTAGLLGYLLLGFFLLFNHYRRVESTAVGFQIQKLEGTNAVRLHGTLLGSFWSLRQITMAAKGENIDIDMVPTYGPWAPSCNFDFVVYLHPETKRVRLGRDRAVIWTRGQEGSK